MTSVVKDLMSKDNMTSMLVQACACESFYGFETTTPRDKYGYR